MLGQVASAVLAAADAAAEAFATAVAVLDDELPAALQPHSRF